LLFHSFDFFVSYVFNPQYLDDLTKGVFKNKLGDTRLYIDKNSNGECTLYFSIGESTLHFKESSTARIKLIQSKFYDDIFYSNLFRKWKFKRFNCKDGKNNKIQLMELNGSVSNYELIK
jgi:hypothetical protein